MEPLWVLLYYIFIYPWFWSVESFLCPPVARHVRKSNAGPENRIRIRPVISQVTNARTTPSGLDTVYKQAQLYGRERGRQTKSSSFVDPDLGGGGLEIEGRRTVFVPQSTRSKSVSAGQLVS
jgi:hypothetical protein